MEVLPASVLSKTNFYDEMTSERIKFSTPLPGEEYRHRDLTTLSGASKVLYEIDFQHGSDNDLCLKILARVFRGDASVTKVVHEHARMFEGGAREEGWRHQAVINRSIKVSLLERDQIDLQERASMTRKEIFMLEKEMRRFTPSKSGSSSSSDVTPVQGEERKTELFETRKEELLELNSQLTGVLRELAALRADLKCTRISREEEHDAKRDYGEERKEEGVWNECLLEILKAILKVDHLPTAERHMDRIVMNEFSTCMRGAFTELEFANEIEKLLKFAEWQAQIIGKGVVSEKDSARYSALAYQTFQKGLRQMERVSWNWIDEEEPRPLAKVLARLRKQSAGVTPTVPALPIRALARGGRTEGGSQRNSEGPYCENAQNLEGTRTGGRRREEEEEEEEEGFELAPPRKISKTPVAQPPAVAAIETMREERMIAAIERLGRTVSEQREARENSYGNMPENNFNNNFTRNTGNNSQESNNRNNSNNFQRNGNDNYNNFTHG